MATFEHCHTNDWAFSKSFYWHTLAAAPTYTVLWGGLTVVGLALAVQTAGEGAVGQAVVCGIAALVCLIRGFLLGWYRMRKEYRQMAANFGKESWSSTMCFTDDAIEMEDDGHPSGKVDWTNIKSLEDQGDWLRLIFRNDAGELYLRKQDFTVGTAAEFQAWLAEAHPEISQAAGKKKA